MWLVFLITTVFLQFSGRTSVGMATNTELIACADFWDFFWRLGALSDDRTFVKQPSDHQEF